MQGFRVTSHQSWTEKWPPVTWPKVRIPRSLLGTDSYANEKQNVNKNVCKYFLIYTTETHGRIKPGIRHLSLQNWLNVLQKSPDQAMWETCWVRRLKVSLGTSTIKLQCKHQEQNLYTIKRSLNRWNEILARALWFQRPLNIKWKCLRPQTTFAVLFHSSEGSLRSYDRFDCNENVTLK